MKGGWKPFHGERRRDLSESIFSGQAGNRRWQSNFQHPARRDVDDLKRYRLAPGDVALAMDRPWVPAGLKFARITESAPEALLVQRAARLRAGAGLEQDFLACLIASPGFVAYVQNVARGVGVPHISGKEIGGFEFLLPPTLVQRAIGAILNTYDDLIENNRRRMALLEESARLLYREWFVHLRFPGHEHTPIVNGVPEGWDRRALESVCVSDDGIQTGPFGSQLHQSDYSEEGVPVVMPKDLVGYRISAASIARIPDELADRLGRHRMQPGDTVYGRRGDIGRRAYIGKRQRGWFCGTGCLRLRPDPAVINPRYLFDTLGAPETLGVIVNRAKGSTMPNLSAGALKTVPLLVAPRKLQDSYAEQVEGLRDMAEVLEEQNEKRRTARDLLLPRLMSGEITP